MNIDEDRLDSFNVRMNDWLAKQGVLFQMKHSGGGGFLFSVWSVFLKLLILCLILALGGVAYLYLRVDQESFQKDFERDLGGYLKDSELSIDGISRIREGLSVYSINASGNEESFYEELTLNGSKFKMTLLSGLWDGWNLGDIHVETMSLQVKAGAGTDDLASQAYASLFTKAENTQFNKVEVLDADIRWGYTKTTAGGIKGTHLSVVELEEEGWLLSMKGGTFKQNWLQGLTIEEIVVEVKPEGVYITKAILNGDDGGKVEFTASIEEGGERPKLKGSGTAEHLSLVHCIDKKYSDFVEGFFSGSFELGGSTNDQEGLEMNWVGEIGVNDHITLWNKVPILKALTVFDPQRSYRKVSFDEGLIQFETNNRTVNFTKIDLSAKDLMSLRGALQAKFPSRAEVSEALGYEVSELLLNVSAADLEHQEAEELTLTKAGNAKSGDESTSLSIAGRGGAKMGEIDLKVDAIQRALNRLHLSGEIDLGVLPDALARYPLLESSYPLDSETQMRWINLEISEEVDEITKSTVDKLYKKAQGKASAEISP